MQKLSEKMANSAKLTIDDLRDVKKALWPARNKWRDIGTEIGEDENSLESIDMTNRKPEDCLREMLGGWLRGAYNPNQKNSKPRTWRTLIDALREKEIGLTDLANNIEKEKYGISVPGLPQQAQGYYYSQPYHQQVPPPGAVYGQTQGGFSQQPVYQTGFHAQQPAHYYGPNQGGGYPQSGGGMQSVPNTQLMPPSTPGQPAPSPQAVHQSPGLPAGAALPQPMPGSSRRLTEKHHADIYRNLDPHAAKWRKIGTALGFKETELDNIGANPILLIQGAPSSYLRQMLNDWLQWAPNDGRGSKDFANTSMLYTALNSINLGALAADILGSI